MATQLPLTGLPLRDSATFQTFYVGQNQQLLTLLQAFVQGDYPEQFIYLWGEPGAGASHLLQACCHSMGDRQLPSMYIPLANKGEYSAAMLESLEAFQLVCLDDIEQINDNAEWQQQIFHLYNRLRDSDRQLIVAGHCPPQELQVLPDLKSRLTWGLTFQVQALTDDEKIKALHMRAQSRGFELSDEVAQFILRRVPRNMTQLLAVFDQLDAASLSAQRRITIPFVKSVLGV